VTPALRPPEQRDDVRLLLLEPDVPRLADLRFAALASQLRPGDVLVLNDAATLPASLPARTAAGEPVEIRLVAALAPDTWRAVLLGPGDWRQPTEQRAGPPPLAPGSLLAVGDGAVAAEVVRQVPGFARLFELRFAAAADRLWPLLYGAGRPVQYSHLQDAQPLWAVQTVYGARPWAVEMPSAGRPLTWGLLLALRRAGVTIATLTHAAGLSATGDPALDRALPLPERYDIPPGTVRAVARGRARGGRVVAVGTTVVRALEGCAARHGDLVPGAGETDLRIGPGFRPAVVDGLLTGIHGPGESHYQLLAALAPPALLEQAWQHAATAGYRGHEFGDSCLVLPRRAAGARSAAAG
jgi:S-adenosylmethionine:tRNA ribosyltransferase-isomerase